MLEINNTYKTKYNFQFNISHTRNAIAVVIFDTFAEVNIDNFKKGELRKFFTKADKEYAHDVADKFDKCF